MGAAIPAVPIWGGGTAYPWNERQTGLVGTSIALAKTPIISQDDALPTPFELFKNGSLMDPSTPDYTLSGNTVTLSVAAIASDRFEAIYWYRVA